MNIWSNRSSNCRCVVFIQRPSLPDTSNTSTRPNLLNRSWDSAKPLKLPSPFFFYPHLSTEELRRFMSEALIRARCCRGNTRRSGSWAEAGSSEPRLQERWDRDALPLPSSHGVKQPQRKTVKRSEEERPNVIGTRSRWKQANKHRSFISDHGGVGRAENSPEQEWLWPPPLLLPHLQNFRSSAKG